MQETLGLHYTSFVKRPVALVSNGALGNQKKKVTERWRGEIKKDGYLPGYANVSIIRLAAFQTIALLFYRQLCSVLSKVHTSPSAAS